MAVALHSRSHGQARSQDFQKGGYLDVWCACHEQSMNHIFLKKRNLDAMHKVIYFAGCISANIRPPSAALGWLGDGGACFPRKCLEIRCSEIALRPFWDRSRAMIATWLEVYCIQFWLSIFAFAKPADIEFPRAKVLQLAEQEVGWQMVKIQKVCRVCAFSER